MTTPVVADDIADSETVVTAAPDEDSSADADSQPPDSVPTAALVADGNISLRRSGHQSKLPDFLVRLS